MNPVDKILDAITPEVYERFKTAVELKKWPDGRPVNKDQLAICLQAIIAYEAVNVAPENRTGYVPPKKTPCADDHSADDAPIKWQNGK